MKVLITGVAGYIGTTLLYKILNETNWDVIGLLRLILRVWSITLVRKLLV